MRPKKHQRVRKILLAERRRHGGNWPWLSELNGDWADKKSANKFMLGSILDYQMKAVLVWENARRFAEVDLGDPRDLWDEIVGIPRWNAPTVRRRYNLHRFPAAHARVQRIGGEIVDRYGGDARKIWKNRTPDKVLNRLLQLRIGPEISRMIVGALHDTKQISGAGQLKADIHVRRVLGRVFTADIVPSDEAHRIANKMRPRTSWKLDRPLYSIGKTQCKKTAPLCGNCPLSKECRYYDQNG